MQLHLDPTTRTIPANYPRTFYRVETFRGGFYRADFDNLTEAQAFAISDSGRGNIDHAVKAMHLGKGH
jgi:hypothetical protein